MAPAAACRMVQDVQWSSVTLQSESTVWQRRVLGSLLRLTHLPQSWDSYGSPRLQSSALEAAAHIISLLSLHNPPLPNITPVPGGGVQFEWECFGRALEVEILPDGTVEFLAVADDGRLTEGQLSETHKQLPRLLHWLTSSNASVARA